jgi:hypothetical protein
MRLRILVILSLVVAGLIVLLKWAPWRSPPPPVGTVETVQPEETAATPAPAPVPAPASLPQRRSGQTTPTPIVEAIVSAPVVPTAAPDLATNWPDRLDEILVGDQPESKKAEALFSMLPKLPLDGQEEVAQHMVNLLTDEQFPATGAYINDTNTPETVTTILMNDMLNRPDPVKLPMLLNLAQVTGHPLAEEAKTILGIYVEQDYGDDWNRWRQGIEEYLKKEAEMEKLENLSPGAPGATPPPSPQ